MSSESTIVQTELNSKIDRMHVLLEAHGLDALLLRRVSSFAWATCGADSHINTAASEGVASLLITSRNRYLLTNNIESPRFEKEEKLLEQGWEFRISPWHSEKDDLAELAGGMKLGVDGPFQNGIDLSREISWLRSQLTLEEIERFTILGGLCAAGMKEAIESVKPGMTEYQIAGLLSGAIESRGVQTIVNLIATDERIFGFRHPLPTDKTLQHYAMLVVCGRKWGLVCSLTRLIHFGRLPEEIRRKAEAVARIDAAMIERTRPGITLNVVFDQAKAAYAEYGYPNEWQYHHQGGSAGYEPREIIAGSFTNQPVLAGQVYAWNPSIAGVKSEDTILVGEQTNKILTEIVGWPFLEVSNEGHSIKRPVILEKA